MKQGQRSNLIRTKSRTQGGKRSPAETLNVKPFIQIKDLLCSWPDRDPKERIGNSERKLTDFELHSCFFGRGSLLR